MHTPTLKYGNASAGHEGVLWWEEAQGVGGLCQEVSWPDLFAVLPRAVLFSRPGVGKAIPSDASRATRKGLGNVAAGLQGEGEEAESAKKRVRGGPRPLRSGA